MHHSTPDELLSVVRSRAEQASQLLVGLVGPPGVGKSTMATWLANESNGVAVPMDGFHLDHRVLVAQGHADRKGAPFTFDSWGFARTIERLANRGDGETVYFPRFDRTIDNAIAGSIEVTDQPVIVVEGNYLLLDDEPWRRARSALDLVAYLDLSERVRLLRLMRRHVRHGKTRRAAAAFVRSSDEVNATRIDAGRERADVVVTVDRFGSGAPAVR
ncbi:MAG: AAA family ATPase [Ilumatobacter sp.]